MDKRMKNFSYLLVIVFFTGACTLHKKTTGFDIKNQESAPDDSTEYELIIFDPGFESWFITHSRPTWYHSKEYYESWNRQYVTAWNGKALSPRYARYFESTIDWDPFVDYGLELNHKLFYYFLYVERELKINILPQGMGPQSVL
jgi:hypothetical protein